MVVLLFYQVQYWKSFLPSGSASLRDFDVGSMAHFARILRIPLTRLGFYSLNSSYRLKLVPSVLSMGWTLSMKL